MNYAVVRNEEPDRVVIEYRNLGEAEYTRGAELETAGGDITEPETAQLEIISVSAAQGEGTGTMLLAKTIEHMQQEGFTHLRACTVNPITVKMMERALTEGRLKNVAYRPSVAEDAFDLPSSELLRDARTVPADEAMSLIGRNLVECVAEL